MFVVMWGFGDCRNEVGRRGFVRERETFSGKYTFGRLALGERRHMKEPQAWPLLHLTTITTPPVSAIVCLLKIPCTVKDISKKI